MVSMKVKEFIPAKAYRITRVNCFYYCVDLDWIFRGKLCKVKTNELEQKSDMYINQPLEDFKRKLVVLVPFCAQLCPNFSSWVYLENARGRIWRYSQSLEGNRRASAEQTHILDHRLEGVICSMYLRESLPLYL
jgi:hypothetical protein